MNLINRPVKESIISSFRSWQYLMIDDLISIGIGYLNNLGLSYDPTLYNGQTPILEKVLDQTYNHVHHYASTRIKLKLEQGNKYFLDLSIPDLIDGTFFHLNNTHYIPMLYIGDEPIVLKEKSISLQSLFQPMTIYFGQKRAIFMGTNFPISDMFQILTYYWDDADKNQVQEAFDINLYEKDIENVITYFSEKLNTQKDINEIQKKLDLLFFDPWTADLYGQFYQIKPSLTEVFRVVSNRKYNEIKPSFIDLRYKRLMFIEHILKPFFKAISFSSIQLIRNNSVRNLKLSLSAIAEHFHSQLNGNCLYDTTNGFSGILSHKASFKNPYGESRLPREVSSIHWTHCGRICPNSIANQDPGENILLVPDQDIDVRHGIFSFTQEEKERE